MERLWRWKLNLLFFIQINIPPFSPALSIQDIILDSIILDYRILFSHFKGKFLCSTEDNFNQD